jgi:transcription elongation factor GreB
MGRWRPPPPQSSPYITPAGFAALQQELEELWRRRREVVQALAAAAAEGDRSENAEYIYRKKELGGIDYRIRYLQKRLPILKVVRDTPGGDRIYFGATVEIADSSGTKKSVRIVGPDETDPANSSISIDSPLAKTLLKKTINDDVALFIDGISMTYTITSITYPGD